MFLKKVIDLRSDTLTTPSKEMREIFRNSVVGDDCYNEDPHVNDLEQYCSDLFDKEDALLVPSGTMANQIALMAQVSEGNEILSESNYHINFYESASTAILTRSVLNCKKTEDGILRVKDLVEMIDSKPRGAMYSNPELVTIENTINYYQGKVFPINEIKRIHAFTQESNIKLHLDGARLFNAHIATGTSLSEYAQNVDTLTVCFAKGLGAPFGSVLMGDEEFIKKARRIRKQFGGGLHQIGGYAAAAKFALMNQLDDLENDHRLANKLSNLLNKIDDIVVNPNQVETNIIFFRFSNDNIDYKHFIDECKTNGLLLFDWLPGVIRIVINRHIEDQDVFDAFEIIHKVIKKLTGSVVLV